MMKKWRGVLLAVLVAAVVLLMIPRDDPAEFVVQLNQTLEPTVGNIRVLDVANNQNYTTVHVEFQLKADAQPKEHFFIKDYKQTDGNLVLAYHKYEGYIYLVKKGLYTWEIVR